MQPNKALLLFSFTWKSLSFLGDQDSQAKTSSKKTKLQDFQFYQTSVRKCWIVDFWAGKGKGDARTAALCGSLLSLIISYMTTARLPDTHQKPTARMLMETAEIDNVQQGQRFIRSPQWSGIPASKS